MALYKGYSSFEPNFTLTDVELVKQDLLNHIFTRKRTRVLLPNFGTAIPDLVFEPLDEQLIELVLEQLIDVFNFDPRVELLEINNQSLPDSNVLLISARILYIELNITENFELNLQFETF